MKKFAYKILLSFTAIVTGMGFTFIPIVASAEETKSVLDPPEVIETFPNGSDTPDLSLELSETEENEYQEEVSEEPTDDENSENEGVEEVNSESSNGSEISASDANNTEGNSSNKVEDGLVPESDGSKWFDEYIMPLLIGLFAPLGGTIAGGGLIGWLLIKGIKVLKNLLTDAINGLIEAKKQTDAADLNLTTAKDQMSIWQSEREKDADKWKANLTEEIKSFVDSIQLWQATQIKELQNYTQKQEEEIQAWKTAQNEIIKQLQTKLEEQLKTAFDQLKSVVTDKVDDTNTAVHKLLTVEKIAYGDNPVLVSNGTARKISEVVDQ